MVRRRVWLMVLAALVLLGTVAPAQVAGADPFFSWKANRSYEAYRSIAWGNNSYIAVGTSGELWTSVDGKNWQYMLGSEKVKASHILFAKDRYFAGGPQGIWQLHGQWEQVLPDVAIDRLYEAGGRLFARGAQSWYTSLDGVAWTQLVGKAPTSIVYQNGVWIGLNFRSTSILRSQDGIQWVDAQVSELPNVIGIAAAGGRFVAVTEESFRKDYGTLTSTDGKVWTKAGTHFSDFPLIGQGEDRILLESDWRLYTSTNGLQWEETSPTVQGPFSELSYSKGVYVIRTYMGALFRSSDGRKWERMTVEPRGNLQGVAFGNGRWVAVGQNGALLLSQDGQTWKAYESQTLANFRQVTWAGGQFVATTGPVDAYACFRQGQCRSLAYTSQDGLTWKSAETDSQGIESVVWGVGRYVGVDLTQRIFTSTDGLHWRAPGRERGQFVSVLFHNGIFLAQGYRDKQYLLYRSTDAVNWQESPLPNGDIWAGELALLNDRFVFVGKDAVYYSVDGLTWGSRPKTGPSVDVVATGGPWYVGEVGSTEALSSGYGLTYSPDGAIWFPPARSSVRFSGIAYGNGRFVAVGGGGLIISWQIDPADAAPCKVSFSDLSADLCPVVTFGLERKSVGGYPDGTFRPDRGITRAEFAKMLGGVFYWKPEPQGAISFTDTAEHWALTGGFLQPAVRRGALSGFPDGTFQPDAPLTRAQLIKVSLAAYGLKPSSNPGTTGLPDTEWYTGWIAKAREVNVYGPAAKYPLWADGPIDPDRPATRAEALTVLFNLMHAGLK